MDEIKLKKIIAGIHGWLTDKEAGFLHKAANDCKGKGAIVEIGSWKGKSTVVIASGLAVENNQKVHAIDPFTGSNEHKTKSGRDAKTFKEFKSNIKKAGLTVKVIPVVKTSSVAVKSWKTPIEFLFIDGAHEYEFVKEDFKKWEPHVIEGGVIAIHDTTATMVQGMPGWPGPRKTVWEDMITSDKFRHVGRVDTITYGEKCRKRSFWDAVNSGLVAFGKLYPDMLSDYFFDYNKRPLLLNLLYKIILSPYLAYRKIKG